MMYNKTFITTIVDSDFGVVKILGFIKAYTEKRKEKWTLDLQNKLLISKVAKLFRRIKKRFYCIRKLKTEQIISGVVM